MQHTLGSLGRRWRTGGIVALAAVVLATGCTVRLGGDDDDASDSDAGGTVTTTAPVDDDDGGGAAADDADGAEPPGGPAGTMGGTVSGGDAGGGAGDVVIGASAYEMALPPPTSDGWGESDVVALGSGGVAVALPPVKLVRTGPFAVALPPDVYVEARFDQGAISDEPADARFGVLCRGTETARTSYSVAVTRQGPGAATGDTAYGWVLYANSPEQRTRLAESESTVDASENRFSVGLSCTAHPDGVQLDVNIAGEWAGGTVTDQVIEGTDVGLQVEAVDSPAMFRVYGFSVYETSREG